MVSVFRGLLPVRPTISAQRVRGQGPGAGFCGSIRYLNLHSDLRDIVVRDCSPFVFLVLPFHGVFIPVFSSTFTSLKASEMAPPGLRDRFSSSAFELFDHLA
jgi:hypothetical protein